MHTFYLLILIGSTFAFAYLGVWLMLMIARKKQLVRAGDEARDNHSVPTPTGAGLGVMIPVAMFLLIANAPGLLLVGMVLLAAVSFIDDIRELSVKERLAVQAIAVILALTSIQGEVFGGFLPIWLERFILFFAWMWVINLHNFMDGIDEITATHTISVCVGMIILGWSTLDMPRFIGNDATVLAAGMAAFYLFNRHPARIFLGDAGSIPLGLLMGYLLFNVAAAGHHQAALILPAYYIADASYTLLRRTLRREKIWQAHSEHAYQQSVRNGRNHHDTSMVIGVLTMVLIMLAVATTLGELIGWVCVLVAYALVIGVMYYFTRPIIESMPAERPSYAQKVSADVQSDQQS